MTPEQSERILSLAREAGYKNGARWEGAYDPLRSYLATLMAEPAPEPVAKMNMPLIWLYSHCRALGMTKHSDSGELEHDIALFVADLKDAAIRKGEAP